MTYGSHSLGSRKKGTLYIAEYTTVVFSSPITVNKSLADLAADTVVQENIYAIIGIANCEIAG